jgi:hypothetical protein
MNEIINEDRQLLLHLSTEELGAIAKSGDQSSSGANSPKNKPLAYITVMGQLSLIGAVFTAIVVFAALIIDISIGASAFSTLLITLWVLLLFYVVYQSYRRMAISELQKWSEEKLSSLATTMYIECVQGENSIQDYIVKKDGKDYFDRSIIVKAHSVKLPETTELSGFKRIFMLYVLLWMFSALVITFSFTLDI